MANKLVHAKRNKKLAQELLTKGDFLDWVITTAFYSSIHFVENKILPCKVNNIHCRNINDIKESYRMNGRHASRERLVVDNLPIDIAVKYKWLDDKSRYSRYSTFKITKQEAEKAIEFLTQIEIACLP